MDATGNVAILFPSDYLNQRKPTTLFEKEYALALADPRVEVRLCNIDAFLEGDMLALDKPLETPSHAI